MTIRLIAILSLFLVNTESQFAPFNRPSFFPRQPRFDPRPHTESPCALIIPGPGQSNAIDHFSGAGPYEGPGTCVTFESIDRAFSAAQGKLRVRLHRGGNSNDDIKELGQVLVATAGILAAQYNLPPDAIYNGLPLIDTTKTSIQDVCPAKIQPSINCEEKRYREFDASCNNLEHADWGSAMTAFKRRVPPAYADGLTVPRVGSDGHPLPSARVVSTHVHRDLGFHDHAVTMWLVIWGQSLDHDMTFTGEVEDKAVEKIECCDIHPRSVNKDCLPIDIPSDDPFFRLFNRKCMNFVRSAPGVRSGCKLGARSQFNEVTSVIDCSYVYGSNGATADKLRTFQGGQLKSLGVFREFGLHDLLPLKMEDPDKGCIRPRNDIYCFLSGDGRVNEQLVLALVHTTFMREHNRIAHELSRINPHWDDNTIYHETRHIIAALIQHITFNEFLPMVLGKDTMAKYDLILQKDGFFGGYDPQTNPGMASSFIGAAFRFGHSLLPSTIERWTPTHKYIASQRLSEHLRQPYDLYKGGWADQYLVGMLNQVAQAMDNAVSGEVTNHLFQEVDKRFGMDLASRNIQRGREHGLPSYNDHREFCGYKRFRNFYELREVMSNETAYSYERIYRSVDDIDLWSAGISERALPGSLVGPTFSCLIGLQMRDLRFGDRFWYENGGWISSFTLEQLDEIRKVKLSRVICDNSDHIETVQVYAMVLHDHEINPRVPCNSQILPRIDLSKWRDLRHSIRPTL